MDTAIDWEAARRRAAALAPPGPKVGRAEAAGLVTTRRVGRVKEHYLNPVPIQQIHRRWIGKYTARARTADALIDLKQELENTTEEGST